MVESAYIVRVASAQIAGVGEHRVDNERLGVVVAAQLEADAVAGHGEHSFDRDLLVAVHLVEHRLFESGRTVGRAQNQIAFGVEVGLGAVDLPADTAG